MTDAVNAPVRRPRLEKHTSDFPTPQMDPVSLDLDHDLVRERIVVSPSAAHLDKVYAEALAFAESPITILINRSTEKFAANVVPCWCNGDGAELLIRGKWVKSGWLPTGVQITTKRKYVEILARSKQTSYTTHEEKAEDSEYVHNQANPNTHQRFAFSVIGDTHPMGGEWLSALHASVE